MLTTGLQRPNNVLSNRLGYGAAWKVPASTNFSLKPFLFLFKLFCSYYLLNLWKSGSMYSNHLFAGPFVLSEYFKTLPFIRTASRVKKYFRLIRLKYSSRFKQRRIFYIRRHLYFLNIGEVFFYRLGSLLLVLLFSHIPEPIKRKSFLVEYLGLNLNKNFLLKTPVYFLNGAGSSNSLLTPFLNKVFYLL